MLCSRDGFPNMFYCLPGVLIRMFWLGGGNGILYPQQQQQQKYSIYYIKGRGTKMGRGKKAKTEKDKNRRMCIWMKKKE